MKGRKPDEFSKAEADQVKSYSELAVKTLYKSLEDEFFDDAVAVGLMRRDDDLNALRGRDDFKEFESLVHKNAQPNNVDKN